VSRPILIEEREGAVAVVRLNRPETLNALDAELVARLASALEQAAADASVRAIVLAGEGGAFCSGADLKEALRALDAEVSLADRLRTFQANIRAIVGAQKPVIAAVDGAAVGFGADLALACDLRLFSERAYLQEKFVGIGLMPDGGGTFHLARLIGPGRALELLLLGEKVDASQALALGLANRILPSSELLPRALELAQRLAAGPPLALAAIKSATRAAMTGTLEDALEREAAGQTQLLRSADLREGITAFTERRKPNFQGN
jgi:2-(1,2-epoxy-1,2-dihydrophenyl)acetyl-CoA isomerase